MYQKTNKVLLGRHYQVDLLYNDFLQPRAQWARLFQNIKTPLREGLN